MGSKRKEELDNTCSYCLYFVPPPNSHHNGRGNCALHNQWIESAARTTCSEMSNRGLAKGIYQLSQQSSGVWEYARRTKPIRTRLFLLAGNGRGEKRERPAVRNRRIRAGSAKLT
jgi:hypothetical protein